MNDIERIFKTDDNTWYISNFSSLGELYDYLKSNPKINFKVFNIFSSPSMFIEYIFTKPANKKFSIYYLSSQKDNQSFSGMDYDKSLECLNGNIDEKLKVNMNKFLELSKDLETKYKVSDNTFKRVKGFYGSIPDVDAYLRDKPNNMIRMERIRESKVIDIYFNLAYPHYTDDEQILNRGIITINLIKLLEKNDYRVRFNTYMLVREKDEIIYIKINLKKDGELLNVSKCFFPLCCKEFLRRLMFRVIESKKVKNTAWHLGYGDNVSITETKELLKINDNKDIVIAYPNDMGIYGDDLYQDAESFMEKINMKKYIKIK